MDNSENSKNKDVQANPTMEAVRQYIPLIKSHDSVIEISNGPELLEKGGVRVTILMEVSLPSRARAKKKSITDVQLHEPIILDFPKEFPWKAPTIKLRKDFNRSLPHINPGSKNDFVRPCIYDGNLDDLLHSGEGMNLILNQISDWLKKASSNTLIDVDQGWEPIRRDEVYGYTIYNKFALRKHIANKQGSIYLKGALHISNKRIIIGITSDIELKGPTWKEFREDSKKKNKTSKSGNTIVLLAWSDSNFKCDTYWPETVFSLKDLRSRADDYGCGTALNKSLKDITNGMGKHDYSLLIIMCARRPFDLINSDSPLEFIAYYAKHEKQKPEITLLPLGHLEECNAELLQRMSGVSRRPSKDIILQLGCGSLGSKISMHLARAGLGRYFLFDNKNFLPHNHARHSLVDFSNKAIPKATLLALHMNKMGIEATPVTSNIINCLDLLLPKGKCLDENTKIVIDSTASPSVQAKLISFPSLKMHGRLMHTSLYGEGKLGLIAIEGLWRKPRLDDLLVKLYDLCIERSDLAKILLDNNLNVGRYDIGQGCGSFTMIMPDSQLSIYAATMAEKARIIIENGAPESGELSIGLLDDKGLSVKWENILIGKTEIVNSTSRNGWQIRILSQANDQIIKEALESGKMETGGGLIGSVSWSNRTVNISRLIPPPSDSIHTGKSFVLGKKGLKEAVKIIQRKSGGTLTYVGTWHSHPAGGIPSDRDHKTLKEMASMRLGMPSVLLVYTPGKYYVLVDEGEFTIN